MLPFKYYDNFSGTFKDVLIFKFNLSSIWLTFLFSRHNCNARVFHSLLRTNFIYFRLLARSKIYVPALFKNEEIIRLNLTFFYFRLRFHFKCIIILLLSFPKKLFFYLFFFRRAYYNFISKFKSTYSRYFCFFVSYYYLLRVLFFFFSGQYLIFFKILTYPYKNYLFSNDVTQFIVQEFRYKCLIMWYIIWDSNFIYYAFNKFDSIIFAIEYVYVYTWNSHIPTFGRWLFIFCVCLCGRYISIFFFFEVIYLVRKYFYFRGWIK